ncbi:MAG: M1 family metallopeptidase [Bacteroidota bacterium]|nr:M1 family metallopeptidase [Bacteroidota bacterium]
MRKLFLSFTLLFFIGTHYTLAQQLYMPRNITNAFKKGTRSMDGNPGKNYWQNEGKYNIAVAVDPETKIVSGKEKIIYTNNSPDTLKWIAIRFVNNFHKPLAPRTGYANPDILTSGLDIQSFSIDGEEYSIDSRNWGTVAGIGLRNPILPHTSVDLNITWDYPLSKASGREGQIDSTTFYVAYSYPRVSVYDDYYGWDMLPHNGGQEFYNDFNDYQLAVKVPKDYVVWATGDFLNPGEVLQPAIAARLEKSYTVDEIIHIADFDEMQQHKVTLQNDWNTWKFAASHITDVCFAVSKNYVWDATSVLVDSKTNRRASVQSAYNDTAKDFHHYAKWEQHSLQYFSTQWPGVAYPYSKMTSFQGYADMEYPMMINDATTNDFKFSQMVQDHEIAHTYFPFYMGTNEKRYAYMDEAWATTFEYLIGQEEFGKAHADSVYKSFRIKRYINDPSAEEDQPIIIMSTQVSGAGYGNNSYGKASLSYLALKDLLGDIVFKKALHHYMKAWHGKHPIPWDYFNAMSAGAQQNLNWFFHNWFFTNNYIDLKIAWAKKEKGYYEVSVQNVGGFAIPFDVKIIYEDGASASIHETPAIWQKNQGEQLLKIPAKKNIKSIKLDGGIFMDYTPEDNVWEK